MPTVSQLIRRPRRKPKKRLDRVLLGRPQREAVVTSTFVLPPKKPNSGNRKAVRIRTADGICATVFVPGEGHNLQEHHKVLVQCGSLPDLSGVRHKVIRGTRDCMGVDGRKTSRSLYGTKKDVVQGKKGKR